MAKVKCSSVAHSSTHTLRQRTLRQLQIQSLMGDEANWEATWQRTAALPLPADVIATREELYRVLQEPMVLNGRHAIRSCYVRPGVIELQSAEAAWITRKLQGLLRPAVDRLVICVTDGAFQCPFVNAGASSHDLPDGGVRFFDVVSANDSRPDWTIDHKLVRDRWSWWGRFKEDVHSLFRLVKVYQTIRERRYADQLADDPLPVGEEPLSTAQRVQCLSRSHPSITDEQRDLVVRTLGNRSHLALTDDELVAKGLSREEAEQILKRMHYDWAPKPSFWLTPRRDVLPGSRSVRSGDLLFLPNGQIDPECLAVRNGVVLLRRDGFVDRRSHAVSTRDVLVTQ